MQFVVLFIRTITPFSYIYLFALWVLNPISQYSSNTFAFNIFTIWMIIEAAFFPYYYHLYYVLNVAKSPLRHYASSQSMRMLLLENCFSAMKQAKDEGIETHLYLRQMMEGWFLGTKVESIMFDNVASWVSWAFMGHDIDDLRPSEREENRELVAYIERQLQWKFQPGCNPNVHSIRLTLDPLFVTQRPFFYYATIALVNYLSHVVLWCAGFRRRHGLHGSTKNGLTIEGRRVEAETQAVYHRPASGKSRLSLPIVFVHGIGIGFAHYLLLLLSLPRDTDLYLLEWPHVSMQLSSLVPSIEQTVATLTALLDADGHPKACFLTHSLGSTAVSWMLHEPSAATRVAATVLLDPVTFLLCDPTVASSFIHREPESTIEFLVHFFVARELHIANALSRHFSWSHNIVFVEELPQMPDRVANTVFLASHDGIIPTAAVERYLEAKRVTGHRGVETVTFGGTHGEIMLYPGWVREIAKKVREKCY